MRIATWNVNGLKSSLEELEVLFRDCDVICLQEIKTDILKYLKKEDFDCFWNPCEYRKNYAGTCLFVKRFLNAELVIKNGVSCCPYEGRDICVKCGDIYIVCVYVPNSGVDRSNPLKRLSFRTTEWDSEFYAMVNAYDKVIVCGDLNIIYRNVDVHNPGSACTKAGFTIKEQISYANTFAKTFQDAWVTVKGKDEIAYTYFGPYAKEKNKGWRLDYQLYKNVVPVKAEVLKEFESSDHVPLVVEWE